MPDIDVGAISEALNNKVDLNQLNTSEAGLEYGSSWSMPSSRYIELTLGASGTTYTAPANGWFYAQCGGSVVLINTTKSNYSIYSSYNGWQGGQTTIPCQKNDVIRFEYNSSSYLVLKFIYAECDQ